MSAHRPVHDSINRWSNILRERNQAKLGLKEQGAWWADMYDMSAPLIRRINDRVILPLWREIAR